MAYSSDLVRTKDWGSEVLTDSDLEGQFDLVINWVMASLNASTGHKHTGAANHAPQIPLTTSVTGTLPLANGGTGQTTLAGILNLVYPIGSLYINAVDATNPGTLLGFGTWVADADGYALVGYKSGDADFGAVGVVAAGEKTHILSIAEMPAHTHDIVITGNDAAANNIHNASTTPQGTVQTGSKGGGGAHNNIQPSKVYYVWRRTA